MWLCGVLNVQVQRRGVEMILIGGCIGLELVRMMTMFVLKLSTNIWVN